MNANSEGFFSKSDETINRRHAKILEIISNNKVSTQIELIELLRQEGIDVTQATISRDINNLKLMKRIDEDGVSRYFKSVAAHDRNNESTVYRKMLFEAMISANPAGNLIVVKTMPGTAQAAAITFDSLKSTDILGCIAGDDTIFLAFDSVENAYNFARRLQGFISSKKKDKSGDKNESFWGIKTKRPFGSKY